MNINQSNTRALWAQSYRLARSLDQSSHTAHRHVMNILSGPCGRMYLMAMQAVHDRHSHTAALMARPLPHSVDAEWLVGTRCASYTRTSGRLPA